MIMSKFNEDQVEPETRTQKLKGSERLTIHELPTRVPDISVVGNLIRLSFSDVSQFFHGFFKTFPRNLDLRHACQRMLSFSEEADGTWHSQFVTVNVFLGLS